MYEDMAMTLKLLYHQVVKLNLNNISSSYFNLCN